MIDTINSVADGSITARRLEAYKKQYLGQLVIASENLESRIIGIARQVLYRGYVIPSDEVIASIKALTTDDIRTVAATLTSPSVLTFGPD